MTIITCKVTPMELVYIKLTGFQLLNVIDNKTFLNSREYRVSHKH